jgi:hypothetical protein
MKKSPIFYQDESDLTPPEADYSKKSPGPDRDAELTKLSGVLRKHGVRKVAVYYGADKFWG